MKRWDIGTGGKMASWEFGDYVLHEDTLKIRLELEAITKERDHYKRLVELSDALRNKQNGYGINPLFNANQGK